MKELLKIVSILSIIFMFNACSSNVEEEQALDLDLEQISLAHLSSTIEDLEEANFEGMSILDTMFTAEFLKREMIIYSRPLENKEVRLTNANTEITVALAALEASPSDEEAKTSYERAMKRKANIELCQHKVDSLEAELKISEKGAIDYFEILMKYSSESGEDNLKPKNYNLRINSNGEVLSSGITRRSDK